MMAPEPTQAPSSPENSRRPRRLAGRGFAGAFLRDLAARRLGRWPVFLPALLDCFVLRLGFGLGWAARDADCRRRLVLLPLFFRLVFLTVLRGAPREAGLRLRAGLTEPSLSSLLRVKVLPPLACQHPSTIYWTHRRGTMPESDRVNGGRPDPCGQ